MIQNLDHIQLAMPHGGEEKARAFFRDILGMEEEEKPKPLASRGGCWFRAGSAILHLGVEERFLPQKKAHPAFCVSDLKELEAAFVAHAIPVAWDHSLPNRRRFYAQDPFGNRMEFIQDGDGFLQK